MSSVLSKMHKNYLINIFELNLLLYIQLPLINLYSMLNATYINNKHNKMIAKNNIIAPIKR